MKPAEAVKIIADDDVNLGMISSVGGKKRKKGAADDHRVLHTHEHSCCRALTRIFLTYMLES